jgi:hypothetical protein
LPLTSWLENQKMLSLLVEGVSDAVGSLFVIGGAKEDDNPKLRRRCRSPDERGGGKKHGAAFYDARGPHLDDTSPMLASSETAALLAYQLSLEQKWAVQAPKDVLSD